MAPLNNVLHLEHKGDGLLIHTVPKVASTSIAKAVAHVRQGRFTPEEISNYPRWMVVRHPLDRLVSAWAFFRDNPDKFYEDRIHGLSFREALPILLSARLLDRHILPQHLHKGDNDVVCCRYEYIEPGWEALRTRFHWLRPLKHIHKSDRGDWRDYYTDTMRKMAQKAYSEDMELYECLT